MDPADPDLDRRLDRELARLSRPRAPQSLLPRVLAATTLRPAATGWFTWPKEWRVASVAAMTALVAAAAWLLSAPPEPVSGMAQSAGQAATTVRVLWDVVLEPAATYLAIIGIVLTLICAAAWAALEVALGGASHR
jgi:type IV secretory pathway VirB2 component (pilin)